MPIRAFIITLPIVTVITALIVFNLEDLVGFTQRLARSLTRSMRDSMYQHRRKRWKRTAEALDDDRTATELPVKKRPRRSTHWMYFVYTLETLFVTIPVYEVRCAFNLWGLRPKVKLTPNPKPARRVDSSNRAQLVKVTEEENKANLRRSIKRSRLARWLIMNIVILGVWIGRLIRVILLFIWVPLLAIEVGFLYIYILCVLAYTGNPAKHAHPGQPDEEDPLAIPFDWMKPFRLLGLHDLNQYPAPTPKQRATKYWRHLSESRNGRHHLDPNRRQNGGVSHSVEPAPFNASTRRRTTFFTPVTRTFSQLFTSKARSRATAEPEMTMGEPIGLGVYANGPKDIEQGGTATELRSADRENLEPINEEEEQRR